MASHSADMMKAIVFTAYKQYDGLSLQEVPRPIPKPDEVLVQVHATSINSWDWESFNGVPFVNRLAFGLFRPRPGKQRLGADIAGVVVATGSAVTRFASGDEVYGDLWDRWGGFAEYACTPETWLESKPANLSFKQAAVVPQAAVLALNGIKKAGALRPGAKVLINGAGGGVGCFAIQLARLAGASVTGVDAAHKLDFIRAVGAENVLDYAVDDFTQSGEVFDLIIDCQNTHSIAELRRVLAPEGTYAMIGGSVLFVMQIVLRSMVARFRGKRPQFSLVYEGPNAGLAYLTELIEAGKLVTHIDREFSLAEVPEAIKAFGSGRHTGKIAITVCP